MLSSDSLHEMLRQFDSKNIILDNELDFQHEIEKYLSSQGYDVEAEYKTSIENKNASVDFLVKDGGKISLIEVKYKIIKAGNILANFVYDFFKDIHRIEYMLDNNPEIDDGFCVFLSNDSRFWKGTRTRNPNANARDFELYDGYILTGTKIWYNKNNNPILAKNYPPIKIRGRYKVVWQDYGHMFVPGQTETLFKYTLVHITRN